MSMERSCIKCDWTLPNVTDIGQIIYDVATICPNCGEEHDNDVIDLAPFVLALLERVTALERATTAPGNILGGLGI